MEDKANSNILKVSKVQSPVKDSALPKGLLRKEGSGSLRERYSVTSDSNFDISSADYDESKVQDDCL